MRTSRYILMDVSITAFLLVGTVIVLESQPALSADQMEVRQSAEINLEQKNAVEMPEVRKAPTLDLKLFPDPKLGWNLQLVLENFNFAFNAPKVPEFPSGYASLYVDGVYRGHLYSIWTNLPDLTPGEHIISVMLLDLEFKMYVHEKEPVGKTLKVHIGEDNTLTVL